VRRTHGKNTTLVAALTPQGLQAPWAIEGALDRLAVEHSVIQVLAPTLPPGPVVIGDHLSGHKAERIRAAITARGGERVFLPADSPDFTPIEQGVSTIKAILRGLGARAHDALLDAISLAVSAVTSEDAYAWFLPAGYSLPLPPS
jgi:transposase